MNVIRDLEVLTEEMSAIGFRLVHATPGSMDSGTAEFSDGGTTIMIVKDRSQWALDGDHGELDRLGLWKAFDSTLEFRKVLVAYARSKRAHPAPKATQANAGQPPS